MTTISVTVDVKLEDFLDDACMDDVLRYFGPEEVWEWLRLNPRPSGHMLPPCSLAEVVRELAAEVEHRVEGRPNRYEAALRDLRRFAEEGELE